MKRFGLILSMALGLASLWLAPLASAQDAAAQPQIAFDSLTGIYHLSRDSRGLSLLTTEETIVADFPGSSYYGITRALPKNFQNHAVDLRILNVTDAAGDQVPYKTSSIGDNLVITTGDPAIALSGSQTIKIIYQTRGVVDLGSKTDEFLLDVNGRGWDQPIGRVDAALYIPASFKASLKGNPTCYTSLNGYNSNNCLINTQKKADTTIITSRAQPVSAHQALVLKLAFAPSTFSNGHSYLARSVWLGVGAILILVAAIYFTKSVIL